MTTITVSVTGNDMTSAVEGKGIAELQKCVDKMQDDLQWTLLIKSKATLVKTNPLAKIDLTPNTERTRPIPSWRKSPAKKSNRKVTKPTVGG